MAQLTVLLGRTNVRAVLTVHGAEDAEEIVMLISVHTIHSHKQQGRDKHTNKQTAQHRVAICRRHIELTWKVLWSGDVPIKCFRAGEYPVPSLISRTVSVDVKHHVHSQSTL